jgi:hypothetical protein
MNRIRLAAAAASALFGLSVLAETPPVITDDTPATLAGPEVPGADRAQRRGEAAINRLATQFVGELNQALSKGGPEVAVEITHLKGMPARGTPVAGMPDVTAFLCTSLQIRDPENAPDPIDKRVLNRIDRELRAGDPPKKAYVVRIGGPDEVLEWRVYRPLATAKECSSCHGEEATMPEALRAKLAARFPADAAKGYGVGEWRGVLRVSLAPEKAGTSP